MKINKTENIEYVKIIYALCLLIILLIVLFNFETIFSSLTKLLLEWTLISVIMIVALYLIFGLFHYIMKYLDSVLEIIIKDIKLLKETVSNIIASNSSGLLTFLSGIVIYIIQEAFSDISSIRRIVITILLSTIFYISSKLATSEHKSDRILGKISFSIPILFLMILPFLSESVLIYKSQLKISDAVLIIVAISALLLVFVFSIVTKKKSS